MLMASLVVIDFSHIDTYEMTQGLLFITLRHQVGQSSQFGIVFFGVWNSKQTGGGCVYHAPFLPCDEYLTEQPTERRIYQGITVQIHPSWLERCGLGPALVCSSGSMKLLADLLVHQEAEPLARSRAKEWNLPVDLKSSAYVQKGSMPFQNSITSQDAIHIQTITMCYKDTFTKVWATL